MHTNIITCVSVLLKQTVYDVCEIILKTEQLFKPSHLVHMRKSLHSSGDTSETSSTCMLGYSNG